MNSISRDVAFVLFPLGLLAAACGSADGGASADGTTLSSASALVKTPPKCPVGESLDCENEGIKGQLICTCVPDATPDAGPPAPSCWNQPPNVTLPAPNLGQCSPFDVATQSPSGTYGDAACPNQFVVDIPYSSLLTQPSARAYAEPVAAIPESECSQLRTVITEMTMYGPTTQGYGMGWEGFQGSWNSALGACVLTQYAGSFTAPLSGISALRLAGEAYLQVSATQQISLPVRVGIRGGGPC